MYNIYMFNQGNIPWNKGKKRPEFSEKWIENMRLSHIGVSSGMKGKRHSEETRRKIADTLRRIGRKPPTPPTIKASKECKHCGKIFHKRKGVSSFWQQKFCSPICKGLARRKPFARQCECGNPKSFNGKVCKACWKKNLKGANCPSWKGGVSSENKRARFNSMGRMWRNSVFKRDNFTCQKCHKIGGKLNAHHIKSFSKYKELRYDLANGITLCEPCHKTTENYGNKKLKN
jgi:hypothetical protein